MEFDVRSSINFSPHRKQIDILTKLIVKIFSWNLVVNIYNLIGKYVKFHKAGNLSIINNSSDNSERTYWKTMRETNALES